MQRGVVLVVGFSAVKRQRRGQRRELRDDFGRKDLGGIKLRDVAFSHFLLGGVLVEDGRPVLRATVRALAIQRGGVVRD